MTEILWNTNAPHSPVRDHELVELRLVDLSNCEESRYLVREIHASWSAATQQIEWKGFEDETHVTRQQAQRSFANRKKSIASAGFRYTTILN